MKIFVSLLPLLTALIAGGANEALPCEEKAVQEISCRTQIVCDVECDAPEYDFDAEETDKVRPRPPLRRPQPRKSKRRKIRRYEERIGRNVQGYVRFEKRTRRYADAHFGKVGRVLQPETGIRQTASKDNQCVAYRKPVLIEKRLQYGKVSVIIKDGSKSSRPFAYMRKK